MPSRLHQVGEGTRASLPSSQRSILSYNDGPWTDIPDAFLQTKIMDLCFNLIHDPPDDILKYISLLGWVPPNHK